ncbi:MULTISPECIES: hypothetical protein [unclassified Acinetobacter]|uniref:hypothetical protein n=1 Tax=unclassified Acinetobacter TaxID=196816 RepID=UPI001D0E808A|nr:MULTISPECIES: hypothetical protein [unclassified Acinetobacter]
MVDTTSNVLGILDGMGDCTNLDSEPLLNGDLQNLFLIEEELQNLANSVLSSL